MADEQTTEPTKDLTLDLGSNQWSVAQRMHFREKVGLGPDQALRRLNEAQVAAFAELKEHPDVVISEAMAALPEEILLGFLWMGLRRTTEPDLTFEDAAARYTGDDLGDAYVAALRKQVAENPIPPTKAARRKTSRSSSPAGTSTVEPTTSG
jgi:hypothetical protein